MEKKTDRTADVGKKGSRANKEAKSYDCPGEDRGYAFDEVEEK